MEQTALDSLAIKDEVDKIVEEDKDDEQESFLEPFIEHKILSLILATFIGILFFLIEIFVLTASEVYADKNEL